MVGLAKILHEGAETTDDCDSHIQGLLDEGFDENWDQLLTNAFDRQHQSNRCHFLHCLPLQVLLLELVVEEGNCVDDQRFDSHIHRGSAHRFDL